MVVLICSNMVSAAFIEVTCSCECNVSGALKDLSAVGVATKGVLSGGDAEYASAANLCQRQCAATCGGLADCSGAPQDCPTCCGTLCVDYDWNYPGVSGDYDPADHLTEYREMCKRSCVNTCKVKKEVYGIQDIVYYVAGIIAAIMFVISGYKFMTSTNPEDRASAKKGVMFVILALIIIAIADPMVKLLITEADISQVGEFYETVSGDGGKILDVHYVLHDGDEITVTVDVVNNGETKNKYRVKLYDKHGNYKASDTKLFSLPLSPGQRHTFTITSTALLAVPWNIYDLDGAFNLKLQICDQEEQCTNTIDDEGPVSVP